MKKVTKKNLFYLIALSIFLLSCFLINNLIVNLTPTTQDITNYLEDYYDLNCLEKECTTFKYDVTENGEKKSITMVLRASESSSKTYSTDVRLNYFSEFDSKYYFRVKIKGYAGKFQIYDESDNIFE